MKHFSLKPQITARQLTSRFSVRHPILFFWYVGVLQVVAPISQRMTIQGFPKDHRLVSNLLVRCSASISYQDEAKAENQYFSFNLTALLLPAIEYKKCVQWTRVNI